MTSVLLDAGALVAVERRDRTLIANLKAAGEAGERLRTNAAVLGQVWRGGSGRQATLAKFLQTVDVLPVDIELGRKAGMLLGMAGVSDVVDASLVAMANHGDRIVTSDVDDLRRLASHAGHRVLVSSY